MGGPPAAVHPSSACASASAVSKDALYAPASSTESRLNTLIALIVVLTELAQSSNVTAICRSSVKCQT